MKPMLLEQDNKKKLRKARQEQEHNMSRHDGLKKHQGTPQQLAHAEMLEE
jgi:hypothetical protein